MTRCGLATGLARIAASWHRALTHRCPHGRLAGALLALALSGAAHAHIASTGFLTLSLTGGALEGSAELAVRDAELAVGLDGNHDGQITWGELRAHQADLAWYLRSKLLISADSGACALQVGGLEVNERVDGNYVWVPIHGRCAGAP